MIASLSLILGCQLAGEIVARGLGLPTPGPVLGLLLLLLLLLARDRLKILARGPLQDGVESASRGLLAHLSLLFVPAGVGIMQEIGLLARHGVAIAVILAVSVVVTLLVTVATFLAVSRLIGRGAARHE